MGDIQTKTQLFKCNTEGKMQTWTATLGEDRVEIVWGLEDGAMQETTQVFADTPIKTAQAFALTHYEAQVRVKIKKGYFETRELANAAHTATYGVTVELDIANLPTALRFYKPQNTLSASLRKLADSGKATFYRKYDGTMAVVGRDKTGLTHILSKGMAYTHPNEPDVPLTDRYHRTMDAVILAVPPDSILLGEMTANGYWGDDNLKTAARFLTARTEKALTMKEPTFVVWDVLKWNGQDLRHLPLADRLRKVVANPLLDVVMYFYFENTATASRYAEDKGWEGFVVVGGDGIYGDKFQSYKGKHPRHVMCGKLKPTLEDDFIAYWDPENGVGTYAKGLPAGRIGSIALYQLDRDTGEPLFIAKAGGLSNEQKETLNDPEWWKDGRVVKAKYARRQPLKDGSSVRSVQFPSFLSFREDKEVDECFYPDRRPETVGRR